MKKLCLVLLCLSLAATLWGQKRALSFEDMFAAGRLSSPVVSPDGQWVVFAVKTPDLAANTFQTDLYAADLQGRTLKKLTDGKGDNSNPRFLESGLLTFISTRSGDPQVCALDLKNPAEIRALTSVVGGVGGFIWSSDGKRIAFAKDVDPRSDVYSIGIIAFEMLTGVLPFTADSALGIAMKQISEPVPGNLSLYPDISQGLRQTVHRALEKRREDRVQSASALEAAFARAEAELTGASEEADGAAMTREVESVLDDLDATARARRQALISGTGAKTPVVPHRARVPVPPLHPPPPPAAPAAPATVPGAPRPTGRPTVFVVMSDGADRISAGKAFADSGCIAVEARTGEEVLELLMSRSPDAVVMDVALPKTDGFEVARILKGTPTFASVPVLLLGNRIDRSQEHFAKQVGASEILPRPVSERDLVARVWKLLGSRGYYRDEAPSARIARPGRPPG